MSRVSKRLLLLQAASEIVLGDGVAALTLDTVAQRAGVSKGGLLYHFPSKESLIAGMLEEYLADFEAQVDGAMIATEPPPGRWLRAYVRTSFADNQPKPFIAAAGLAAIVSQPELLARVQERYKVWQARAMEDGVTERTAMLVMQATDGLWLSDMFGLQPVDDTARIEMLALLLTLIEENR